MKRIATTLRAALLAIAIALNINPVHAQQHAWQRAGLTPQQRAEALLAELTLDEKLSLMVHQNPAIERLGLPAYSWWNEALHGVARAGEATVYPMPIALAATFDPQLVQSIFADVAIEAQSKYLAAQDTGFSGDYAGLTFFTPNINIFRDPRWGRGMETYGEDPYLTARMGLACVQGLERSVGQGRDRGLAAAACLKHFAVHSGPEGTRHEFDSRVSDRDLRTTYLPAFEYVILRNGVSQVMCGYNRLNGSPCCTNRRLFDILRHEWGYEGLLVTDCWALNDAYEMDTVIPRHRTHATAAEAYADAFGREVDLECGSGLPALREAVQQGLLSEADVDRHVRRILRTRFAVEAGARHATPGAAADPARCLEAARSSIVLLKNSGLLPLEQGTRIFLTGPNATDSLMPLGNYNGTPRHTSTIAEGLAAYFSLVGNIDEADVVLYAGGLSPQLEGEELPVDEPGFYRGDRTRIELPEAQRREIDALSAYDKPLVLLLCSGSAVGLEQVEGRAQAVVAAWYGGQAMGQAVAQQLCRQATTGCFGRLPITFYRSTDQLPLFDDYNMRGRTYRYITSTPLYPFGYGLDYLPYSIAAAHIDRTEPSVVTTVRAAEGDGRVEWVDAKVQLYLSIPTDREGPRSQLVGIGHAKLRAGEQAEVRISIDPFWLRVYDEASAHMQAPHTDTKLLLSVGKHSADPTAIMLPVRMGELK